MSLRPRGVYALDVLSQHGNPVLMSVDSHGRFAGWAEVPPGADYLATRRQLVTALDASDPVSTDVLDSARPLRLVRLPPRPARDLSATVLPF